MAIIIIATALLVAKKSDSGNSSDSSKSITEKIFSGGNKYPKCPADLSGILKAPLMDAKYISALTPLGNINPPGHTAPVDHIYFATNYDGRIPLYAPDS